MGYKLFNPIGLGILGKLKQGGGGSVVLWDGNITYNLFIISNELRPGTGDLKNSILIDVENLDDGATIKIVVGDTINTAKLSWNSQSISEFLPQIPTLPASGYVTGYISHVYLNAGVEYLFYDVIKPAGAKMAVFNFTSDGTGSIASVEVV